MIRGTKHISVVRENARKTNASTGVENGATARAQIRMKSGELGNTMPINALRNHLASKAVVELCPLLRDSGGGVLPGCFSFGCEGRPWKAWNTSPVRKRVESAQLWNALRFAPAAGHGPEQKVNTVEWLNSKATMRRQPQN